MDLSQLRGQLARVTELVERWQALHKIDALERDLALEKLRQLYDAILDGAPSPMQPLPEEVRPSEEEVPFEEEPADEEVLPVSLDLEDIFTMPELPAEEEAFTAPEPESVEESEPEPVAEPEPELVTEPEPEPRPEPEPVVAPAPEQSAYVASSLFGPEEEQLVRHRHKQRVIMSLYDNEPTAGAASLFGENPAPKSAPAPSVEPAPVAPKPVVETSAPQAEPTPAVEPSTPAPAPAPAPAQTVLGEVINPHMQTLADTLPPAVDRASELRRQEKVTDLRKAIGINDKFLLIRDLFGGDGATYEITIRTLNNFEDFDECMIYIAENFAWNPNSDGAKLLMDLLERKFA